VSNVHYSSGSPLWGAVCGVHHVGVTNVGTSSGGEMSAVFISRRDHQCGMSYIYIYIERERETTTYCSDIQAFIVVTRYIDGFTAGRR
jgi:hypothetical protein